MGSSHAAITYAGTNYVYQCLDNKCDMALAFAGSDDIGDWVKNAQATRRVADTVYSGCRVTGVTGYGPHRGYSWFTSIENCTAAGCSDCGDVRLSSGNTYHQGFYEYVQMLAPCVNHYRHILKSNSIEVAYITGHSLGGASATIYAQEYGLPVKGVATYGAPKTNWEVGGAEDVVGWRFMHMNDPVTSDLCFLPNILVQSNKDLCNGFACDDPRYGLSACVMGGLQHVIRSAYVMFDRVTKHEIQTNVQEKREKCQKKWWKFWCWFEYIWVQVFEILWNVKRCTSPVFNKRQTLLKSIPTELGQQAYRTGNLTVTALDTNTDDKIRKWSDIAYRFGANHGSEGKGRSMALWGALRKYELGMPWFWGSNHAMFRLA